MKKLLNKKVIAALVALILAIVGTFITISPDVESTITVIAVEKLVPAEGTVEATDVK